MGSLGSERKIFWEKAKVLRKMATNHPKDS